MLLRGATGRELDQLTARVLDGTRTSGCRLNAYRIDTNFHIDIELPGADAAGIDVTADENVLTVRATRNVPATPSTDAGKSTVTKQILVADELDTDRLEARYENDVLTLSIPISKSITTKSLH